MAEHNAPPEQDAAIAKQAFAAGDLGHTVHHIGCALVSNPENGEWLGLLEAALRRADDPLALTKLEGEASFVTAASRAYAYALRGAWADALSLLSQVVATRPDVPYLAWVMRWIPHAGVLQQIPLDVLMPNLLIPLVKNVPFIRGPSDPCIGNVRHAERILAGVRQVYPHAFVFYASSVVARRLGSFDEGVALARKSYEIEPSYMSAIALANALKDAGQVDAAIQAFSDARRFDANDLSTYLDTGDMLTRAGRYGEAVDAYGKVLAREPRHEWALPSAYYARWKQLGNPADRAAILAMGDDNTRARELSEELSPRVPYDTSLPFPGDAMAKALSEIADMVTKDPSKGAGGKVGLNITHPESPSILLAFRLATAHVRPPIAIELTVERIQTPDPRVPKGQVDFVLWAYEGTNARPNVPPADPRVLDAVARIASLPFDMEAWEPRAKELAAQLGPAWVQQLACVMVNPPPVPDANVSAFGWVARVQIAAALVLAFIEPVGTPWEGSARKKALFSIALGPVDWTVDAALIAMGRLARQDVTIRRDVEQLFAWLETQIPAGSFTCFEYPLACVWLSLGGHDPATRQRLEAWRHKIETVGGRDKD